MKLIPGVEFRAWLAEGGIEPHSTWGKTGILSFAGNEGISRFWFPSFVPSDLPGFIGTALKAASPLGPYYLQRRGGGDWIDAIDDTGSFSDQLIATILTAAGVPQGVEGALCLDRSEWQRLLLVISAFYVFGWSVGEDLYIVGAERDCLLMTSHHGELKVAFPTEERCERFRQAMLAEGYDLPTEVPDGTFKSPDWLTGRVRRGTV